MTDNTNEEGTVCDMTVRTQTKVLSIEFIVTFIVQAVVFLIMGSMAFTSVTARVDALEGQQVTDARIARVEEKLNMVVESQREIKSALDRQQFRQEARDSSQSH